MFAVKSFRYSTNQLVWCGLNATLNSAIAFIFITFMSGQLFFQILWPTTSAVVFFIFGLIFFYLLRNASLVKKVIAAFAILTLEIYLTLAWIYPASYFIFYGTKQALQHDICCETPKDYGARDFQTIKISMSDGVKIEGWYVAPNPEKNITILLIHGSDNDRRHASDHARFLISAGYGVFMYDQRGNGQSEGFLDSLNPTLGHDLIEVTEWLRKNYQPKKIGVVGLSLGAHAALSATALRPDLFSALWLDGLQAQALSDFPSSMDNLTRVQANLIFAQMQFIDLIRDKNAEGYEAVTQVLPTLKQVPIYLVAGDAEKFESDANRNYAQFSNDHLQVWMVPDGGHLTAVSDFPEDYQAKLLSFFNRSM